MTAPAAPPATMNDAVAAYHDYLAERLVELRGHALTLRANIGNGAVTAAMQAWLDAQQTWQRVGAAYGSFGDLGDAIAPGSRGLDGGAESPDFKGLRRIEYGLWHGQGAGELIPVVDKLLEDIAALEAKLPETAVEPSDMPLRLHEILEDAQRDHLSGRGDQGSGLALALARADVEATQEVLEVLRGLLENLKAGFPARLDAELAAVAAAIDATQRDDAWADYAKVPRDERQAVNAALGRALESLSLVPALFSTD
ncbi:EfeM/EfeO family lipoprotein [Sinomonas sp. ASV322]|uniref:EfeM/EfeO family lipoprotein n=1 Tax=Sinomonas sp. ASV322 TaxID=3041920 RepID=UPI0027DC46AB|nr:EfeM/EfeO family lipoprotein [Sinomonas sp. ASV322]MDQ4504062.1 EfeM/EfeO family lipoprotein [Sinomonas sp. ASV322]